jgi:threonine/homoserine/homoserine lactone efflux protein
MPSPEVFAAFAVASLALLIVPGPSVLYIVTRSMDQGRAAGLVSVLGIHTGSIVHVAAAALGLSAILASSALSFGIVKYAGAAYLIWLGIRTIRERGEERPGVSGREHSLRRIYAQGVVVNVLNPKTALFFLAFLPQFIDLDAPLKPLAFLFLGVIFTFNATLWNLFVAWSAARMSAALGSRAVDWFQRCLGAFFVYLGVRLAGRGD